MMLSKMRPRCSSESGKPRALSGPPMLLVELPERSAAATVSSNAAASATPATVNSTRAYPNVGRIVLTPKQVSPETSHQRLASDSSCFVNVHDPDPLHSSRMVTAG